jgi:hypothetical protein
VCGVVLLALKSIISRLTKQIHNDATIMILQPSPGVPLVADEPPDGEIELADEQTLLAGSPWSRSTPRIAAMASWTSSRSAEFSGSRESSGGKPGVKVRVGRVVAQRGVLEQLA